MLIKSGLVTQMSGSVGGITGAHNQGGLYFRARALPTNPASAEQAAVRNALTILTSRWSSTLTAAQRTAWNVYNDNVTLVNRLGDARHIGAIGHYLRSNVPRLQAGLAAVDDGPTTFDLGSFTAPSGQFADADTETQFTFDNTDAWANETGSAMLVYTSRSLSPAINFFKGPYRLAGSIAGDDTTAPSSPASLTSSFTGVSGNNMFAQVRVTRADGRLSGLVRLQMTQV